MSAPYVVARRLGKSFETIACSRTCRSTVDPGDVIGVLGKNGAGKTTLLELMLGFTPPTAGSGAAIRPRQLPLPGRGQVAHRIRATAGRVDQPAHRRGPDRRDCVVLPPLGRRAHRQAHEGLGARPPRADQGHVGGPAAEALDPARARPPSRSFDPRRARRKPRSDRPPTVPRADHRGDGRRRAGSGVLVAHRVRHRAAREQDLDREGQPALLARRLRYVDGIDRARASARHSTAARDARDSERAIARARRAVRDSRRSRLDRRAAPRLGARLDAEVEIENLTLEDIFLELHR